MEVSAAPPIQAAGSTAREVSAGHRTANTLTGGTARAMSAQHKSGADLQHNLWREEIVCPQSELSGISFAGAEIACTVPTLRYVLNAHMGQKERETELEVGNAKHQTPHLQAHALPRPPHGSTPPSESGINCVGSAHRTENTQHDTGAATTTIRARPHDLGPAPPPPSPLKHHRRILLFCASLPCFPDSSRVTC